MSVTNLYLHSVHKVEKLEGSLLSLGAALHSPAPV